MFKDYYAILGVSANASADEIRSAFRTLALQYHPDKTLSAPPTVNYTAIQEAYDVLSDIGRRYLYDMSYAEYVREMELRAAEAERYALEAEMQATIAREKERDRIVQQQQLEREKTHPELDTTLPLFTMDQQPYKKPTRQEPKGKPPVARRAKVPPPPVISSAPPSNLTSPRGEKQGSLSCSNDPLEAPGGSFVSTLSGVDSPSGDSQARRKSKSLPPPTRLKRFTPRSSNSTQKDNHNTTLPSISMTKTVSLSLSEMLSQSSAKPKKPKEKPKTQEYYEKRAIEKTLRAFFSPDASRSDVSSH
ncbi:chaperone protein DnaJ [Angomonas deanei]|uniref:DnaJ domain containing protein, putative n=1 Tax=Angomonas deanei TaxID=59799 RepID=A0A7G2CCG1_9TRYP|nr:chaperone protein DnaJ [Angomonas deanei]CAD2216627.1 DnaJ domain containing protein, putative [Angomonas deanei]|eukprot:EPY23193.1 chaperone protein DnaJ [Angomonas deanei]